MVYTKIKTCIDESIGIIQLNNPETYNALGYAMTKELLHALESFEADEAVRIVLIKGSGKAFSGGGDIKEMHAYMQEGKVAIDDTIADMSLVPLVIKKMRKIVIAMAHGAVAGAAANICLACDLCLAAENAQFIQAFVRIGLAPDAGGLFLLSRAVGHTRALQIALTGDPISARQAQDLGMVYAVYPLETVERETLALARRFSQGPLQSYAAIKHLLYQSEFRDFDNYRQEEIRAQIGCGHSFDHSEGVSAFVEKRKAVFTGR